MTMGRNKRTANLLKSVYNHWVFVALIPFLFALVDFLFPEFMQDVFSKKQRVYFLIISLLILILPLWITLLKRFIEIIRNGLIFDKVTQEKIVLEERIQLLLSKISYVENSLNRCESQKEQLVRNAIESVNTGNKFIFADISYAYSIDKEVFIVIPQIERIPTNTILECFLIDTKDFYLFGKFDDTKEKDDGIHICCIGETDPMLLSFVKSNQKSYLRPTTIALLSKEN